MKPKQISLVYATWCPHCDPLSVEETKKMAQDLGVPFRLLDIDMVGSVADELVKNFGDNSEDYIIPQVFVEFPDGRIEHIFTGFSEDTTLTKKQWENLFKSKYYESLKKN